jgi:hypothetical protein
MKILGTTLLALLGIANGAKVINHSRISSERVSMAEVDAQTSHSCQYAINRIKAGPADFTTIIGSG